MTKVIKLISLANGDAVPAFDGKYVVAYEPLKWDYRDVSSTAEVEEMIGEWLTVTDDPALARRFSGAAEAHAFWRQLGKGVRPWDGKPNRPLTAFNIEILPLPVL